MTMQSVVTKSQKIQDLVHQMKTGEISKTQLFAELSKLQRSNSQTQATDHSSSKSSVAPKPQARDAPVEYPSAATSTISSVHESRKVNEPAYEVEDSSESQSVRSSHSSTAQRRAEIQALFEEKRRMHEQQVRDRLQQQNHHYPDDSARERPCTPPPLPPTNETRDDSRNYDYEFAEHQQDIRDMEFASQPRFGSPVDLMSHNRATQQDTRRDRIAARIQQSFQTRKGNDLSIKDARTRQLMQQVENKRMEECTFRPQITQLPTSYVGKAEPQKIRLEDRTMRWRDQKLQAAAQRQQEQIEREMQECTFHPQINHSSRMAAEDSRRATDSSCIPAGERLYGDSKTSRKAMLQAKYKAEREEELRRQCTFRPNINRRYATPVKSRYREDQYRGVRSTSNIPAEEQELTFKPKVNDIPANMGSAQLYVSEQVFDRLSKPRDHIDGTSAANKTELSKSGDNTSGRVIDISTFLSGQEETKGGGEGSELRRKRPSSAAVNRSKSMVTDSNKSNCLTPAERRHRQEQFEQFLARQKQREARRQKKLQDVEKRNNPSYKPELCKKSVNMVKSVKQGNFMQRLAKDALRKEQREKEMELKRAQADNPECTFKPKITKAAQRMPPRSPTELSRGDSLRKETNTRLMKLKAEQDEVAGHSFQPNLNGNYNVEGRLKILSEPETYLRRLQREAVVFSERQRRAIQEQEMKEFAECTFTPKVHDAPKYIKRIARSMMQSRLERKAQSVAQAPKPDWR